MLPTLASPPRPRADVSDGVARLQESFSAAVEATARRAERDGASQRTAFAILATRIEHLGAGTAPDADAVCRTAFELLSSPPPTVSAAGLCAPEHEAPREAAAGVMLALDQLLGLLAERDAATRRAVAVVRGAVHRLIYCVAPTATPEDATKASEDLLRSGALPPLPGPAHKAPVWAAAPAVPLPPPQRHIDGFATADAAAPFLRAPLFAEAAAVAMRQRDTSETAAALSRKQQRLSHLFARRFVSLRCRSSLLRCFVAWRAEVRHAAAASKLQAELKAARLGMHTLQDSASSAHARNTARHAASEKRYQVLSDDLAATQQNYDAFRGVAQSARHEVVTLRDQVSDLRRGALRRAEEALDSAKAELEAWTACSGAAKGTAADNAFENANRARVAFVLDEGLEVRTARTTVVKRRTATPHEPAALGAAGASFPVLEAAVEPADMARWAALVAEPLLAAVFHEAGIPAVAAGPDVAAALFTAVVPHSTAALLALAHAVSPGHLPLAAVRRVAGREADEAALLLATLGEMGCPPPLPCAEAVAERGQGGHTLIVAAVLGRFCGVGASVPLLPPAVEDRRLWEQHMPRSLARAFDAASQPPARHPGVSDFLRAAQATALGLSRWQALGQGCLVAGAAAATKAAAEDSTLSRAEQWQMARFTVQPAAQQLCGQLGVPPEVLRAAEDTAFLPKVRALRGAYLHYATAGPAGPTMAVEGFVQLLSDAGLTTTAVGGLTEAATRDLVSAAAPDGVLGPGEFMASLVLVAARLVERARGADMGRQLARTLEAEVVAPVLEQCPAVAVAEFRERWRSPGVAALLDTHRGLLVRLHDRFATEPGRVTEPNFLDLCRACGMEADGERSEEADGAAVRLPRRVLSKLFSQVLAAVNEDPQGTDDAASDPGLSFAGLNEAIFALALARLPSPYLSGRYKLRDFLSTTLHAVVALS